MNVILSSASVSIEIIIWGFSLNQLIWGMALTNFTISGQVKFCREPKTALKYIVYIKKHQIVEASVQCDII